MSDELKGAIITAIVTGIISIIGFVVIYNSMKKNFKNELEKEKTRACLKIGMAEAGRVREYIWSKRRIYYV